MQIIILILQGKVKPKVTATVRTSLGSDGEENKSAEIDNLKIFLLGEARKLERSASVSDLRNTSSTGTRKRTLSQNSKGTVSWVRGEKKDAVESVATEEPVEVPTETDNSQDTPKKEYSKLKTAVLATTSALGAGTLLAAGLAFTPWLSPHMMIQFMPGFGLVNTLFISGAALLLVSSTFYSCDKNSLRDTSIQFVAGLGVAGVCQASIHVLPQYFAIIATSNVNMALVVFWSSLAIGLASGGAQYFFKQKDVQETGSMFSVIAPQAAVSVCSGASMLALNMFMPNLTFAILPVIIVEQVLVSLLVNSFINTGINMMHS